MKIHWKLIDVLEIQVTVKMSHKFEEYKRSSGSSTSVWSQFLRDTNGQAAKCKKCNKIIKCSGGSTSTLHNHLRSAHNLNLCKRSTDEIDEPIKALNNTITSTSTNTAISAKSRITEYFPSQIDQSLPAVISRMTALDGIPFSLFCTSKDLRNLLVTKGYKDVPTHREMKLDIIPNRG